MARERRPSWWAALGQTPQMRREVFVSAFVCVYLRLAEQPPGGTCHPAARSSWYDPASSRLVARRLRRPHRSAAYQNIRRRRSFRDCQRSRQAVPVCPRRTRLGQSLGGEVFGRAGTELLRADGGLPLVADKPVLSAVCPRALRHRDEKCPMRYTACATAPTPASTGCAR